MVDMLKQKPKGLGPRFGGNGGLAPKAKSQQKKRNGPSSKRFTIALPFLFFRKGFFAFYFSKVRVFLFLAKGNSLSLVHEPQGSKWPKPFPPCI